MINYSDVPKDNVDIVKRTFYKRRSIFSIGSLDIGRTELVEHEIHLDKPRPFKKPYHTAQRGLIEEVKEHLKEIQDIGAVQPSNNLSSSKVVIVRKKDGTIRFYSASGN